MNGFHSFWSKPNTIRNQGRIIFPDFELFTTILSALEWRKHNGSIRMITDSEGAAFFREMGLSQLWDEMDTSLDEIGDEIDPFLFWAGGKLVALRQMAAPCVMLDTDLIIWKNVDWVRQYDIVAAHPEGLNPRIYPGREAFRFRDGYVLPEEWDFTLDAANTAFLFLKNGDFKDRYVASAIEVFNHMELEGQNTVTAMCFAEQRVLPMCAAAKHQQLGYLMRLEGANQQNTVTHTWGLKKLFRDRPEARRDFCMRCTRRIVEEFPEMEEVLADCEPLRSYYLEYKKGRIGR